MVVFSFDSTGSMCHVLDEVRTNITEMADRLLKDIPNIRIGIDLCTDGSALCAWVKGVGELDSDSIPKAYEYVLCEAQTFSWQGLNCAFVLMGDAPPHKDSFTDQGIFWGDELDKCVAMGIKVNGVQVRSSPECADFFHEISECSGGIYLVLDQFSLINSMFVAVCYKQLGNEKVDQYCKELEQQGQLDQGHMNMFGAYQSNAVHPS
eukprot:m51a1_g8116 putative von willebrand factor type a (207) ;mRNA; f:141509-142344